MEKELELTVDFEIKPTKKDAITKATLRKVLELIRKDHKDESITAFIKDTTGTEYCFNITRNRQRYYFSYSNAYVIECTLTESEGNTDKEVTTTLWVDWEDVKHKKLGYQYAEYEVDRC